MESNHSRWDAFKGNASDFLKKRGLFVVLGLCALCIAIAALVRFLPAGQDGGPDSLDPGQETNQSKDETLDQALTIPAGTPTAAPAMAPAAAPTATPKPAQKKETLKSAPPVSGKVIWGYAADHLLYSETLEQWTTHEGVDISAKMGQDVHAIRAGSVERIYEDNALGVTVVLSHDGGLSSVYANLSENKELKEGQKIDTGDIIGYVGDTALSECAMAPHIHFAIYQDGKAQDPLKHILME